MSSGKDHTAATIGLAIIYTTVDYTVGPWMLLGIFIQPDLDVDGGYIGNFYLLKYPPLYHAWRIYWWPYSKLVPHRSFWSHSPLIGTLLRILYLVGPFSILYYLSQNTWPNFGVAWIPVVKALVLTDFLHFVMDYYNSDTSR